MHAVGWNTVTLSKDNGGLGLRDLGTMNQVCIMKLSLKMLNQTNELWCKILQSKYQFDYAKGSCNAKKSNSRLWKAVSNSMPQLLEMCIWRIENGKNIHAWQDCWVEAGKSIAEHNLNIPIAMINARVCDLVDEEGDWNWTLMESWVPKNLWFALEAILPLVGNDDEDYMQIEDTEDGCFSVGSTYNKLHAEVDIDKDGTWNQIWRLRVPERVKTFIWLLKHDRLMTNMRKNLWGIDDAACQLCGNVAESTLHAVRDCPRAKQAWDKLIPIQILGRFYYVDLQDCIKLNLNGQGNDLEWRNTWAMGCHANWTWRNKEIHVEDFARPVDTGSIIANRVRDYGNAIMLHHVALGGKQNVELAKWSPPRDGFVKLNVDGACRNGNLVGCGGVIRDSHGNWICGFSKFIGRCSVFLAEVWGVFEGLKISSSRGFAKVVFNIDSKRVVDVIKQPYKNNRSELALIRQIRLLITKHEAVEIVQADRETNTVADHLAKLGRKSKSGLKFFEEALRV